MTILSSMIAIFESYSSVHIVPCSEIGFDFAFARYALPPVN